MDYKDYIREEVFDIYIQKKDNLANRIIEAKYNLQFLKMMHERSELYHQNRELTDNYGIRVILRRIYVTVAWELALQIKAFTDDTDADSLTIPDLHKNMFKYIKDDKRQELYDNIGAVVRSEKWKECDKLVKGISDYRNKIVGHNTLNPPELYFSIDEAEQVIMVYESLYKVLIFNDTSYIERTKAIDEEMKDFIKDYLDLVLPLV